MPEETTMDRRAFLREGPAAFLRVFLPDDRPAGRGEEPPPKPSPPPLRPPGAIREEVFGEVCRGDAACARACPADAIRIVPRPGDPERVHPVIVPNEAACVVCDDLACTKACPSGALAPVTAPEEIRIGVARVHPEECLAWAGMDLGCDYCVDRCPLGARAISMTRGERGRGPVVQGGCIGCGVCEHYCPTRPSAIRVYARDS